MQKVYIARIIKRTAVEKMVYDDDFKKDIETTFMFDETTWMSHHLHLENAEESLKEMMGFCPCDGWMPDKFNIMYGSSARYHSTHHKDKCGNTIDYFAVIDEDELA